MEKCKNLFLWWGFSHTISLCQLILLLGLNFLPQPKSAHSCPITLNHSYNRVPPASGTGMVQTWNGWKEPGLLLAILNTAVQSIDLLYKLYRISDDLLIQRNKKVVAQPTPFYSSELVYCLKSYTTYKKVIFLNLFTRSNRVNRLAILKGPFYSNLSINLLPNQKSKKVKTELTTYLPYSSS